MDKHLRAGLIDAWRAGVDAVRGDVVVCAALKAASSFSPDLVLSVGKASSSMCMAALEGLPGLLRAIVVVPRGSAVATFRGSADVTVLESSHPLPDQSSLDAGRALLDAVSEQAQYSKLLLLVSGGASAMAEDLVNTTDLKHLRQLTSEWLASGLDIAEINENRVELSNLKGGKLLREFPGAEIRVYAISDVQGDDIRIIGSGIGDVALARCPRETTVVATNGMARDAVAQWATSDGQAVIVNEETLYGDVCEVADGICTKLREGTPGIYIWGGEPVVTLPNNPGLGGRNQSLALAIALGIQGRTDIGVIAAGTDGIDGNSNAAGGIVGGNTVDDAGLARRHLDGADAGSWLAAHDAAFVSGPTDTNVMDLVVAIVGARSRA